MPLKVVCLLLQLMVIHKYSRPYLLTNPVKIQHRLSLDIAEMKPVAEYLVQDARDHYAARL